jgi:hypothetical protein
MAQTSDGNGLAPELVRQATERTRTATSWLEQHEPGDLFTEERAFARRRPGVFLAGAAIAGILAGRLTRASPRPGPSRRPSVLERTRWPARRFPDAGLCPTARAAGHTARIGAAMTVPPEAPSGVHARTDG